MTEPGAEGTIRRWWLLPGLASFVLARLPSFLEPHWYTDEAGYVTTGQQLLRGHMLYLDVWNNKPPIHLWTVAATVGAFGHSEAALHALTFVSGLLTLGAVAYAARRLLAPWRRCLALIVVGLLLGTPVLDAELILPESLLMAPTAWAGALLVTRLYGRLDRPPGHGGLALEWWPAGVGLLAGAGIAYQQTAVADAAAFGLILLVAERAWRRLLVYLLAVAAVTAAWLVPTLAIAGRSRVSYALAGFYVDYTRAVLPSDPRAGVLHWSLVLLLTAGIAAGALLRWRGLPPPSRGRVGGTMAPTWPLWVWAGAALLVTDAAHQSYAHFLTPAVAPTALAVASLGAPRAAGRGLGDLLLVASVLGAGVMAHTAGLDWVPQLSAPGMNGYRTLAGYYWGSGDSVLQPSTRPTWDDYFDARVSGDAAAAAWVRGHGYAGRGAVVWSNDAWPYALADLRPLLPTPPIYNNFNLVSRDPGTQKQQTAALVGRLAPDLIITGDDAVAQFPDIKPVLGRYRVVESSHHVTVWLRDDLPPRASPPAHP